MKELINYKTLIIVMVVGFIALLPMVVQAGKKRQAVSSSL